jgi:hypothetical protein
LIVEMSFFFRSVELNFSNKPERRTGSSFTHATSDSKRGKGYRMEVSLDFRLVVQKEEGCIKFRPEAGSILPSLLVCASYGDGICPYLRYVGMTCLPEPCAPIE